MSSKERSEIVRKARGHYSCKTNTQSQTHRGFLKIRVSRMLSVSSHVFSSYYIDIALNFKRFLPLKSSPLSLKSLFPSTRLSDSSEGEDLTPSDTTHTKRPKNTVGRERTETAPRITHSGKKLRNWVRLPGFLITLRLCAVA